MVVNGLYFTCFTSLLALKRTAFYGVQLIAFVIKTHKSEHLIMTTANCKKFKEEIENYMVNGQNNIDSKTNNDFCSLTLKT